VHSGLPRLVARYASHLHNRRLRVEVGVKLVRSVRGFDERGACVHALLHTPPHVAAAQAGGDPLTAGHPLVHEAEVAEILRAAVESLRLDDLGDNLGNDLKKIKGLEWLCFRDEHKCEAVAQANELLRGFFLAPSATATHLLRATTLPAARSAAAASEETKKAEQGDGGAPQAFFGPAAGPAAWWRVDSAEMLLLDDTGLGNTDGGLVFPDQVLAAMRGGNAPFGRPPADWGRVLKEHQCWRVLLGALQAFKDFRAALALAKTRVPAFQAKSSSRPNAAAFLEQQGSGEDEEVMYRSRLASVRQVQALEQWLEESGPEVLSKLGKCADRLREVLDFGPAPSAGPPCGLQDQPGICPPPESAARCFGPKRDGEADYSSASWDMVAELERVGVDPTGWMLFEQDYLKGLDSGRGGASEKEFSSDAPKGLEKGPASEKLSVSTETWGAASRALRRAVLPSTIRLLWDAHHSAGLWFAEGARRVEQFLAGAATGAGTNLAERAQELNRLATAQFQSALQVADMAASKRLGIAACMDGQQVKGLLAGCHASALVLVDLTGRVEVE